MSEGFLFAGTREAEAEPLRLIAGALTADLSNGNLRSIRHGGIEVLRAVSYIVRDRDWGTYDPTISNLDVRQDGASFAVTYDAACTGPGGVTLRFSVRIEGDATGLSFAATATPDGDFETNRCGFCILHPIVGLAGTPVTVEHVDGAVIQTTLPDLIDPWQPFKDMRAITHAVAPGLAAECRMEGDRFEMEDQRNWSDASYKTYVRPLALPWPYVMPGGQSQTQSVTLSFARESVPPPLTPPLKGEGDKEAAEPPSMVVADSAESPSPLRGGVRGEAAIAVELGEPGPALPRQALVIYPEDAMATLASIAKIKALNPQSLLLHFDPTRGHAAPEMVALAQVAAALTVPATLECALPCQRDLDIETAEIAALVGDAGLKLEAVAVSPSVDRQSTPPGSEWPDCPPLEDIYAAARRAFPDVRLGGGMLSYFTELNRKRVPAGQLDFITHCTCPIVHAGDDLSVMQSLEALPFITRSTRAIYGDKPYRIGPSTIAMRQNPYGSATKDNPHLARIAMADRDPRHNALFAAAWAVGYAARVAPAGLEQLTLAAFAGPFGLIAGDDEPSPAGQPRPLFHVVKALAELAGQQSVVIETGDDSRLAGLAARDGDQLTNLLANLSPEPVDVSGLDANEIELLDADAVRAGSGWRTVKPAGGRLSLGPYAVARVLG